PFGRLPRPDPAALRKNSRPRRRHLTPLGSRWSPRRGGAGFDMGDDIDDDRLVRLYRFGQSRRERIDPLDADPAHPKASRDRGEVGRAKTDQLLSPSRPIAG